jgi:polyisoprenoid-binding protein YceI
MTLSEAQGIFTDYSGELNFEPTSSTLSSVSATILSSSVDTGDAKRDAHLKKSDFFYVDKFPKMTFSSTNIKKINGQLFDVTGVLEIRGIRKIIVLKTLFKGLMKDHIGKESAFFTATTIVNRKDFGLVWNKLMDNSDYLLGDKVQIDLVIQAQPLGRKTAFSSHMIPATEALEKQAKLRLNRVEKALPQKSFPDIKSTKKIMTPESFEFVDVLVGFLGFCLLIGVSFFIKMKIIKSLSPDYHVENSLPPLIADLVIILLTFLYTVWFFQYLYGEN